MSSHSARLLGVEPLEDRLTPGLLGGLLSPVEGLLSQPVIGANSNSGSPPPASAGLQLGLSILGSGLQVHLSLPGSGLVGGLLGGLGLDAGSSRAQTSASAGLTLALGGLGLDAGVSGAQVGQPGAPSHGNAPLPLGNPLPITLPLPSLSQPTASATAAAAPETLNVLVPGASAPAGAVLPVSSPSSVLNILVPGAALPPGRRYRSLQRPPGKDRVKRRPPRLPW